MSEQITVVGTIVNDLERRMTGGGATVANFRLASNVRRKDETTGAWVDGHTNWYSVSAYRGLAEHALESFRKGQRVIVVGAFKLREWEANGKQGVAAEVDATAVGHDLLWGTSEFTRAERSGGSQGPVSDPTQGAAVHRTGDHGGSDAAGAGAPSDWAPAPMYEPPASPATAGGQEPTPF